MRALLAIMGGFVVSLGMFVGGLVFATAMLTEEPAQQPGPDLDLAEVWTSTPRVIDAEAQHFQRLPAVMPDGVVVAAAADPAPLDGMGTGAVPADAQDDERLANDSADPLNAAHLDWCARRYRSYNASDNSYRPYSGGRRTCISPYVGEGARPGLAEPAVSAGEGFYAVDDVSGGGVRFALDAEGLGAGRSEDHLRDCFSRYRSYQPADNTYQPYGGGPRRPCE